MPSRLYLQGARAVGHLHKGSIPEALIWPSLVSCSQTLCMCVCLPCTVSAPAYVRARDPLLQSWMHAAGTWEARL